MTIRKLLLPTIAAALISCGKDPLPKPKAMLRLDYQKPEYTKVDIRLPFTFEKNTVADKISNIKLDGVNNTIGVNINILVWMSGVEGLKVRPSKIVSDSVEYDKSSRNKTSENSSTKFCKGALTSKERSICAVSKHESPNVRNPMREQISRAFKYPIL